MLETIAYSILNGVLYGTLLFMMSSGLTLIFGMMGVLNFAHASFYMLGAYFAYTLGQATGFWVALFIAPILVGSVGAIVERYGLRRVHQFGHVPELLFTFGLAYVIEELVALFWGTVPVPYKMPDALNFTAFNLFGLDYSMFKVFILLVAVAMFVGLWVLLKKTRAGLVIQGSLSRPDMVGALGHNVPRVFMLVFAFGCALAGLGGVVGGIQFVTDPGMAFMMGPIVFVVVVLGGLGSVPGALVASLIIGILQTFFLSVNFSLAETIGTLGIEDSGFFGVLWHMEATRIAPVLPFLLLVLTLIFRPRGLFGKREA
ncbi:amino acid/amide ABC transporter membrane protein 1, HAAT family [Marinobacter daqiaonensis]|uniref:Amino acid/amide ABC transporter membrane protein 1, HAAT family n=1 Tax=Marinobacter daqiaonensis TaxID=650891 RepID=A0A1I6I6Q0_9GAMM|nr:branched-chain amino acid ABC transporter permease [Marinobacter daqiaonensis]SFR62386.1 amino acid/amide ABC transporter membrane protein 1, HAAT family [Marinobacter daqiaonensis]